MSAIGGILENIPIVGGILGKVADKLTDSEKHSAELALKQIELEALRVQGQLDINAKEAEHSSVFVAGWRPFVGWVCGAGFVYEFVLRPFLEFFSQMWGWGAIPPHLGSVLTELCFGLLGLGTLRSFEKWKGVAR